MQSDFEGHGLKVAFNKSPISLQTISLQPYL